jgi:hypothetical protein
VEAEMKDSVPVEVITNKIYLIRGQKVMLDRDLAELYGVETRVLKQAVKRNITRFPVDFMFELSRAEFNNLRSQIVISSWGGIRYRPMAFTEQGVAMLSSVLNSNRAIQVNIKIMRACTKLRHLTTILKESGALTAEALWSASQLDIDDFYDQLKDEEARGLLEEHRGDSPTAPRLLEAAA